MLKWIKSTLKFKAITQFADLYLGAIRTDPEKLLEETRPRKGSW